jgi:acyl-CoA thioesterase YciA
MLDEASATNRPDEEPVIRIATTPMDANVYGGVFGGWLLSIMDAGAGLVAARFTRGQTATVAVDEIALSAPVKVGDEVSVYGRVGRIGRTSFVVPVEAWKRDRHEDEAYPVGRALFTFVALDGDGKPRPVAPNSAGGIR